MAIYLKHRPRCVSRFAFEGNTGQLIGHADPDWAGEEDALDWERVCPNS